MLGEEVGDNRFVGGRWKERVREYLHEALDEVDLLEGVVDNLAVSFVCVVIRITWTKVAGE